MPLKDRDYPCFVFHLYRCFSVKRHKIEPVCKSCSFNTSCATVAVGSPTLSLNLVLNLHSSWRTPCSNWCRASRSVVLQLQHNAARHIKLFQLDNGLHNRLDLILSVTTNLNRVIFAIPRATPAITCEARSLPRLLVGLLYSKMVQLLVAIQ